MIGLTCMPGSEWKRFEEEWTKAFSVISSLKAFEWIKVQFLNALSSIKNGILNLRDFDYFFIHNQRETKKIQKWNWICFKYLSLSFLVLNFDNFKNNRESKKNFKVQKLKF